MSDMVSIDQWLESSRGGMTDERLAEVFDMVKPKGNWKYPIDAEVAYDWATEDEIRRAVIWFAGGVPDIHREQTPDEDIWVVRGAGYYEWVGA